MKSGVQGHFFSDKHDPSHGHLCLSSCSKNNKHAASAVPGACHGALTPQARFQLVITEFHEGGGSGNVCTYKCGNKKKFMFKSHS